MKNFPWRPAVTLSLSALAWIGAGLLFANARDEDSWGYLAGLVLFMGAAFSLLVLWMSSALDGR